MNKNWAGSNGVITLLAFMASAALLLSAYSFYTFRKQNLNLNNTVTLDAGSSQLKVWNGNEWQNIGGAQPGQVLGIIDGKPGWIETSGSTSDSFANTTFGAGLVRTGDKTAYNLSLANCNSGQVLQATGSSWECATITNPAPAPAPTYSAGNGINISGSNVISSVLGNSVSSVELESGAVTSANLATDSVSSANIINGTILLADLNDNGCNIGQIFKYDGSGWVCAADNAGAGSYMFTVGDGTNTQTIDNTDLLRFNSGGSIAVSVGATDTVTLDVANSAITGAKILDGSVGFADFSGNGCANGQIIKFNGSAWVCGTDNVNDADSSTTNELQNLSLGANILSLSGSAGTVNLAPYLDNTDAQNLSYVAGTQTLSIGGGNSISLSTLLDNTDSQAISKTGDTLSITGSAGTVDLSGYLDNTDVLASLACVNGQVAQWNGSAWVCANAGVDTDDQTLSLIANTLSISEGNSVSLAGYLDNTDAQAISRSGNTISITGNAGTVDLSPYLDNTDAQNLSYVAGTQTLSIGGGNSVSLASLLDNTDSQGISKAGNTLSITGSAGTVDLSGYLDNTDVLAGLSCGTNQIAKYNGSAWVCAADNVNDADASATNELQDLSLSVNILSLSGSAATISLASYLDNTDSQTITYTQATQVLSISGGNTANLSSLLDNTDSQAISKTGNTLSITGNAGTVDLSSYLDNTDVLGSLSCSNTQIAKYNGSAWVCAADNDTDTTYSAGTGINLAGTTFSATLGTSIDSSEIVDGSILFADLSANSCTNGQIFKYNGSAWVCGADNVNDADASATNELQDLSLSVNVLSLSSSAATIDLSPYLDNTDSQNLSYVSGTQTLSIGGGNSVSLASLLDNTDAQAISKTGNTLSISGNASTVDLSGYLDNTDVLGSLSCSNTQIAKYNGSAWVCAADNVNDADASSTNELQDLGLSTNTLSLTGSATTIDLSPYLDNTDAQAISRSGNTISITGNAGTVDLSPYLDNTDAQNLSYVSGTQTLSIGGGNSVSLASLLDNTDSQGISKTGNTLSITGSAGTVDLSGYLDNTDAQSISKAGNTLSITGSAGTVDLSGYLDNTDVLAGLSCGTNQIAKYNGSAWVCAADNDTTYSAGTGISIGATVISATLGTDIDSSEIVNGTIADADIANATITNSKLANSSVTVTAGTGLTGGGAVSLGGTVTLNSSLGTAIDTSEITDGTILFGDFASNGCGTNAVIKYNGSAWVCGTDLTGGTVNSFETLATSGGTNPVADSSTDTLTLTGGTGVTVVGDGTTDTVTFAAVLGIDIDSSEIVNGTITNADIAAGTISNANLANSSVTVTAGTGLTGGGAVSLGGTVTLNSSLGTAIDTTEITDGTLLFADIASNGCGTNAIFKYNGSAWICGTDVDTDTTYSAGTGISFGGTVISSTLGTDIASSEIVDGTITATDVAANTFAQLGVAAAQTDSSTNGLIFINKTGASGNLLQLQVAGVDKFLVAYDGTIDTASVDSASIVDGSIANGDLANSSLTVTAGTGLTGGGAVSLGGTVTLNNAFGTSIDNTEVTADSLDFTEIKDTLALDATTTIAAGASNFVLNLDGTGDFLVQDNGTTVLSVLDDGTFLFKNSTDGATAFDIQDSSGVDMFVIDTTNDRIYIGDPTADSVGALLVLDTKNSSGDPTGVNGAMYYNSNIGKFRCFENSEWRDCLTSSRTGYFYRNEMMGATTDNELAWAVTGAGAANSATAITSVAGRPGVLQHATGTTATGNARGISRNTNGILLGNSSLFGFEAPVRITTLSTGTERFSYRAGFIDSGTAESVDGCFYRYSDATNTGKWEGVCRNNNTESVCDTGITVAAATWYRLNVTVNAAGTNANFATDGTSRCNVTTNIPTGAGRGTSMGTMMLKSIGTTTRTIDIDYIEVRAELPVR